MAALARIWLRLDRDPETRSEIEELLATQDFAQIDKLMGSRLSFGTAGLRAPMGAGFARINSLTIIQTSQGLAEYLLQEEDASPRSRGIVIGYDARHNSEKFAELAAAAFTAKGIPVLWYEEYVHTPMVPFAVKQLGAAAGIMITASHNPAQYNGYKVYGSNGCQINTPVDEKIAASILLNMDPITWDLTAQAERRKPILQSMRVKYFDALWEYAGRNTKNFPPCVYTPMHGVGCSYMKAAVANSDIIHLVEEQADPNPDFPTVSYPNPEEDGALTLAMATADRFDIPLIIANDPDADRFAAAEKVQGHWYQFTGDQVGVLLGTFLRETGQLAANGLALKSVVSSQMLSAIAKDAFRVEETLTGFKWIGSRALEMGGQYGYEEALGYMFPSITHDKDGIAAAVIFLSACAVWGSPWARLQQLYQQFGFFETINTYWTSPNLATTMLVFSKIRALGSPYPTHMAGGNVLRWRDLTTGYDSSTEDEKPTLPTSPKSQMITCWLEGNSSQDNNMEGDDGVRFTIRTSGTEPKIKGKQANFQIWDIAKAISCNLVYLECSAKNQEAARHGAESMLQFIKTELLNDPDLRMEKRYCEVLP
ncbi:hypothetical protein ACLMJK_000388 [Lecanora helva]